MKKILLAAGTILISATATFAQESTRYYVGEADPAIKSQFAADFPAAENAHFARMKQLNVVSFTQDKENMYAYYTERNELVGTVHKGSVADLPDNALKEIQHKYPDYTIANVIKFDDRESDDMEMILFGLSLDDANNYFVELKNNTNAIVVKVDLIGEVDYLTAMK